MAKAFWVRELLLSGIIIVGVFLDALTKSAVTFLWKANYDWFADGSYRAGEYLRLEYHQNTGIAFSFPIEWVFLKILTVALIIWILVYWYTHERVKKQLGTDLSFALILSGAIGNAIERISQWYVTDFIALKGFAIFNGADILISVGAVLLMFSVFHYERSR